MRFALIATVAVLAVSAASATDSAAAVGQQQQKGKKHRTLRNAKAADVAAADQLATEDEGYWDRFLQNEVDSITPPPTPPPTPIGECGVEVSDCVLLGAFVG